MKKYIVCVEVKSHDMWEVQAVNKKDAEKSVRVSYDEGLEPHATILVGRKFLEVLEKDA